ncbi:MAG: hypothetical protein H8E76_01540 [Helicobacteraceae bacterium]|nr:hypothetical protein [Candidatus Sulfurimonas ponti]
MAHELNVIYDPSANEKKFRLSSVSSTCSETSIVISKPTTLVSDAPKALL